MTRIVRVTRIVIVILLGCLIGAAAIFGGPLMSGGLLLLLPSYGPSAEHDLPESYEPLHKGHIDLATGLYIREDEDLVVRGTPPLILRRTYLSRYHVSRHFGIGTTHNGETYLVGDGARFQWISLILPTGTRVTFQRISPGSAVLNALYEHRASPGEWQGTRLGWTGFSWAMRRPDETLTVFRSCGPGIAAVCSIVRERDADGHTIHYRRDAAGRLSRIEAPANRWIAFAYDGQNRITRAYDNTDHEMRYEYDNRGRLSVARATDGRMHRCTYTDRDEMATIVDPGIAIKNAYDADGRCIQQTNTFPGDPQPFTYQFTYRTEAGAIVQTDTTQSDGTWSRYTFDGDHYTTTETWGRIGMEPAVFTYERDPATNTITGLTLTCPDRTGRPLRHSSLIRAGNEEWIKWDLLQTHCSWRARRGRGAASLGPR